MYFCLQVDTTVPLHHSTPEDGIIGGGGGGGQGGSKEDNVSNAGSAHSAAAAEDKTAAAAAANQSGSANQGGGRRSTASGSAELKMTWFNFAAPPKTPISKKIDFTKLDWNLLSTASPSIDAWLGPVDRLQQGGHSIDVFDFG